jgi:signal transduction histidine kinase
MHGVSQAAPGPEGGKIQVHTKRDSNLAVIEVIDNGSGISAEARPHLFERFYRADKARSRNSGGAGLGLSIVKSICTAHGAEIKIETQEGRGSRFRVALPLAPLAESSGSGVVVRNYAT